MKFQTAKDRVIIKIDLTQKERYKLPNGVEIYLSRGHNYNLREDNPNVAEVLGAEKIPVGSLVLIHHNATQDSYKVFGEENIFAIPADQVFLYNFEGEWIPNEGFVISSRIFKPYKGFLIGIDNELVKNRMYIHKGKNEGNVCVTKKHCDYEIIFFIDGVEGHIIRTREREMLAIDNELTQTVKNGEYIIGLNSKEAKTLQNDTKKATQTN